MQISLTKQNTTALHTTLLNHFGPRHWWPGDTPTEVAIGAVLTQNTAWTNVVKAIDNLRARGLLDFKALRDIPLAELAGLIHPSGYHNQKARKLLYLAAFLIERCDGDVTRLAEWPSEQARSELLTVWGIGPETADSILLYAAEIPTFVIDAYTHRVLTRHGLASGPYRYEELRAAFQSILPRDVALYNEFHALFVAVGKDFCRSKPRCEGCPLNGIK